MYSEINNAILGLMLVNLNTGKKTLAAEEINKITEDREFSSRAVDETVNRLTADGLLSESGRGQYAISADIGALRGYILKCEEQKRVNERESAISVDKIMDTPWTLKRYKLFGDGSAEDDNDGDDDEEEDDDDNDIEDFSRSAFDSIEEHRKRFLHGFVRGGDEDDSDGEEENDEDDELKIQALKYCIEQGEASAAMIQRRFSIGILRSYKIIEWMQKYEYIAQFGGSRKKVIITMPEFERIFGDRDDDGEDGAFLQALRRIRNRKAEEKSGRQNALFNLVSALRLVVRCKSGPVSSETIPPRSLWPDGEQFKKEVFARIDRIILSDRNMGRQGAVKKAEACLEGVRDTHDRAMVEVYERVVYELKHISDYMFRQYKRELCGDGE